MSLLQQMGGGTAGAGGGVIDLPPSMSTEMSNTVWRSWGSQAWMAAMLPPGGASHPLTGPQTTLLKQPC